MTLSIVDLVAIDPVGTDRFVATRCPANARRILGSGLLAASLLAAGTTCGRRPFVPGSLHATFLRAGQPDRLVELSVTRLHDGRTSASRLVTVAQDETPIMTASLRFFEPFDAPEWQGQVLYDVGPGDGAQEDAAVSRLELLADFEVRAAVAHQGGRAVMHPYWVRYRHPLPSDPLVHAGLVALLTDIGVSGSARRPGTPLRERLAPVSLDHALWWHRPVRADDWLLITARSLTESGGRALARGEVATLTGVLVASFVQDALLPRGREAGR